MPMSSVPTDDPSHGDGSILGDPLMIGSGAEGPSKEEPCPQKGSPMVGSGDGGTPSSSTITGNGYPTAGSLQPPTNTSDSYYPVKNGGGPGNQYEDVAETEIPEDDPKPGEDLDNEVYTCFLRFSSQAMCFELELILLVTGPKPSVSQPRLECAFGYHSIRHISFRRPARDIFMIKTIIYSENTSQECTENISQTLDGPLSFQDI